MKSAVIFLGILIPALSVFNIISALKKDRKSPAVLNGIFYGIIVLLIVLSGVNKAVRAKAIYDEDKSMPIRKSHKNPVVTRVYEEYLEKPCSHKAHELLHTHYVARDKHYN